MKKVLVSGGAGYIGSILCQVLLNENYFVRVIDNLMFSGESIVHLLNHPNFEFSKIDIRETENLKKALNEIDYVVHLAAIVGDPACAKNPKLAKEINLMSSKNLYKLSNEAQVERFVFASTCSNYGKMMNGEYVNESSPLNPVSLYAETKVEFENYILNQPRHNVCKPTSLRFSTVYGLSPRVRFDLTVNEFTKDLALGRELLVFGKQFWRPYCHVVDLARSVAQTLSSNQKLVAYEVFNVGDTNENYRKGDIVEQIKKQIPDSKIKFVKKDEDPRDYRVSFEKIKKVMGFQITKTVPQGISQIKNAVLNGLISNPDDPKYRNS